MASSDGSAAAAALKARGYAGILSSESAGVMAVMRQNAKWALVPGYGYGDEDERDDPMLEEFRAMRRALFTWRDWDKVAPIAYLAPFLQVIRSVETSGPITGCVQISEAPRPRTRRGLVTDPEDLENHSVPSPSVSNPAITSTRPFQRIPFGYSYIETRRIRRPHDGRASTQHIADHILPISLPSLPIISPNIL